jgi:hypothetical protein
MATPPSKLLNGLMADVGVAPRFTLTISFSPGQPPQISGPLADKMLCYGMLEVARDVIKDYKPDAIPIIGAGALNGLPVSGR